MLGYMQNNERDRDGLSIPFAFGEVMDMCKIIIK